MSVRTDVAATGIPSSELAERRERLLEHVRAQRLNGFVLFDETYIRYFGGFSFLATERPVAFAVNAAGDAVVFVPEFEVERVRAETEFERVESYPEYPGEEHPMRILQRVLEDMGIARRRRRGAGRLPGHPRLRGPCAERGAAARRLSARAVHRGRCSCARARTRSR